MKIGLTAMDYWLYAGLLGVIALLIIVLVFAVKVHTYQRDQRSQKLRSA